MTSEFFKYAVSLTQKLLVQGECFVKAEKSTRKYRTIFLSNIFFYVLSEDKVKYKLAVSKLKKLILSSNSGQMVFCSDSLQILIDDLEIREKLRKEIANLNNSVEISHVPQTMLDEYIDGAKTEEKEEGTLLNLLRLRKDYEQFPDKTQEFKFSQQYNSIDLLGKGESWILMTVERRRQKPKKKHSFFKREKKQLYTVRAYNRRALIQSANMNAQAFRQRKCLELILSPYVPLLYKCHVSTTYLYCITQHYVGQPLTNYMHNQSLSKSNLRSLLSQLVFAIGQLHECNFTYIVLSMNSVLVSNEGYLILNDFSMCSETRTIPDPDVKDFITKKYPDWIGKEVHHGWDWYSLGLLIYQIHEGCSFKEGEIISWDKELDLSSLVTSLLERVPQKRIGFRNDYHEIMSHNYFGSVDKKSLATRSCQPLKKFFRPNPQKISFQQSGQQYQIDSAFEAYEFSRQLQ